MQLSLNSTHTAVRSNKSPRASSSGIFRLTIEAIRYSSSTLPLSFFLFLVISSCLQNVASGPNDPVPVTAQELSYSAVNPDYRAYVLCRGTFPLAANSYTPININIGAVPCPDGYNYIKTNIDNNGLNNKPFFWRDPSDTSGGPQGTRPSDLYVFPPQRDDYCSYSSTSVTCLALGGQPINPTKHRRDEVNEDESELQAGGSQSHLERRCGGWAQSSFTFMNSLPKNLCFVTTDDLLAANLPKDTTTPGGPYTMNPATYPCGNRNDYSLSKCSISGLVEVGDPNNFLTYNIAYACYSTDSNVNYCGASSCQMIKMAHGAVDSAADTFILGFKRYMTSNPSIWRHCWSYPSQPSNFPPTQKKGGGINLDKIAPLFSVFKQGETNSRASDITYKWGGNHFKVYHNLYRTLVACEMVKSIGILQDIGWLSHLQPREWPIVLMRFGEILEVKFPRSLIMLIYRCQSASVQPLAHITDSRMNF